MIGKHQPRNVPHRQDNEMHGHFISGTVSLSLSLCFYHKGMIWANDDPNLIRLWTNNRRLPLPLIWLCATWPTTNYGETLVSKVSGSIKFPENSFSFLSTFVPWNEVTSSSGWILYVGEGEEISKLVSVKPTVTFQLLHKSKKVFVHFLPPCWR